jgi:hypothetical protein
MALQQMASGGAPPMAAYGAAWLLTFACVLVVQLARVSEFSAMPFVILLTLGVGASAWASRFPLSEGARLVYGFLDGALALICLTGQSFLNSIFGIGLDASIENYLSLSFLWYLCLRSALMVTMNALVFQSVPALALFGLIATYMLAAQILWLFVLMLLGVLFLMLASHRLEWGRGRVSLETGYAVRTVFASGALAGLLAFLATPILALTIGRAISTVVVGMPLRGNFRTTPSETPPELQVGAGAASLSDMEVLRVRIEGSAQPRYLRMESYNIYTGRGWNRGRVFYEEMLPLGQGKFAPQRVPDAPETASSHGDRDAQHRLASDSVRAWLPAGGGGARAPAAVCALGGGGCQLPSAGRGRALHDSRLPPARRPAHPAPAAAFGVAVPVSVARAPRVSRTRS